MKQTLLPVTAIMLLLSLSTASSASEADIRIGGSAVYNRWDPAWNNRKLIFYPPDMIKLIDSRAPSYSPLEYVSYGPDLSIRFMRRWELSPSFRYGTATTGGGGTALLPDLIYRQLEFAIKKYDLHATLGYRFIEILRLFAGLRAEIIDYTVEYRHVSLLPPLDFFRTSVQGRSLHFTPEIGIGVALPVSAIFSVHTSLSGTFQSGSDKSEYKNPFSLKGPELGMRRIPAGRYQALGFNTSLSLQFAIPRINTSVAIGAHYRLLRYIQKASRRGMFALDGSVEHIAGGGVTVSYHFSFAQKRPHKIWIPRPRYD